MTELDRAAMAVSGALGGISAYATLQVTGAVNAAIALIGVSWLSYRLLSPSRMIGTLRLLLNPPTAFLLGFIPCFAFVAFNGTRAPASILISAAAGILMSAVSITLSGLWNG